MVGIVCVCGHHEEVHAGNICVAGNCKCQAFTPQPPPKIVDGYIPLRLERAELTLEEQSIINRLMEKAEASGEPDHAFGVGYLAGMLMRFVKTRSTVPREGEK